LTYGLMGNRRNCKKNKNKQKTYIFWINFCIWWKFDKSYW